MKIAVCDDELTVREQVSDIIKTYFDERKRNAELTLYESGSKMIEDKEAYDIIFLDIEMPEINGIETAEALRKWDRDRRSIAEMGCKKQDHLSDQLQ